MYTPAGIHTNDHRTSKYERYICHYFERKLCFICMCLPWMYTCQAQKGSHDIETPTCKMTDVSFLASQRFSGSNLVLNTVESRFATLSYFASGSISMMWSSKWSFCLKMYVTKQQCYPSVTTSHNHMTLSPSTYKWMPRKVHRLLLAENFVLLFKVSTQNQNAPNNHNWSRYMSGKWERAPAEMRLWELGVCVRDVERLSPASHLEAKFLKTPTGYIWPIKRHHLGSFRSAIDVKSNRAPLRDVVADMPTAHGKILLPQRLVSWGYACVLCDLCGWVLQSIHECETLFELFRWLANAMNP